MIFVFLVFSLFFSPQLILQKSNGQFQRNLSFFKVPDGVQHFPGGGGQLFPGASNFLFPIETRITCDFPGGVRTPCPPPPPPPLSGSELELNSNFLLNIHCQSKPHDLIGCHHAHARYKLFKNLGSWYVSSGMLAQHNYAYTLSYLNHRYNVKECGQAGLKLHLKSAWKSLHHLHLHLVSSRNV